MNPSIARVVCWAALAASVGLVASTSPTAQTGRAPATAPQVGSAVPPFSGADQFGNARTLESAIGAKGAMLVFFRSADW